MKEIEFLYERGVCIPLEKMDFPERCIIKVKIESVRKIEDTKFYSYFRLLREGEEADELFEF